MFELKGLEIVLVDFQTRRVEILVDIRTTEIQVKLLFKYSEFMVGSREAGVVEWRNAVSKLGIIQ